MSKIISTKVFDRTGVQTHNPIIAVDSSQWCVVAHLVVFSRHGIEELLVRGSKEVLCCVLEQATLSYAYGTGSTQEDRKFPT